MWAEVIVCLLVGARLSVGDICSTVPLQVRTDCHPEHQGDVNVLKQTCLDRGCNWCKTTSPGVPWCFHQVDFTDTCSTSISEANREDCIPFGLATKDKCENRGCVYCESTTPGVPWCFFNGGKAGGDTCPSGLPDSMKFDCFPNPTGSIKDECVKRGCFYCESSTAGVPWCFYDTSDWLDKPYVPRDEEKVNCMPERFETNAHDCSQRGCVYAQSSKYGVPWCYVPPYNGYEIVNDVEQTAKGYRVQLKRGIVSLYGGHINNAVVEIEFQTNSRLRIKIFDANKSRFEVPLHIPSPDTKAGNPLYEVNIIKQPVFALQIKRKDTGTVLFDTTLGGMVLEDQFLQIATRLPSSNIYGFGMHQHYSFKHDMNFKAWGMFSRDQPPADNANMYGVHPFYECLENDGNAHAVLFLNSNAQDVLLQPAPSLTYRTIGGVLDIYMFLGPSPEQAISQYTEAVGRPMMPPYWSLGFSIARFGYHTLPNMKDVVNQMKNQRMPMDYIFGDIDYMDRKLDFTYDKNNYGGYPEYIRELQKDGIRTILILDPAIAIGEPRGQYPAFDDGNRENIWVKRPDNTPAQGKVWPPSDVYYPDFFHPRAADWWIKQCKSLKSVLNYDGLWIDMNEPANFVWGDVNGCSNSMLNHPPYFPKIYGPVLNYKSLCPDHKHHIGKHYDVHSLYGWSQAEPTVRAARQATLKRSIVLSRSTFPGAGKYVATWLGDNWSYWSNLKFSVIGMLEFNLFGIPMVGADICGFIRNAQYEMCMRWHQLGVFYPFSRNHNMAYENSQMQEPTQWGTFFADNARYHINLRYTLLPYLYTLFYRAHVFGETVVRPLFHEFPRDSRTHSIDEQFLWGKAFMVSPVLHQGVTSLKVYFPGPSKWFSYYDGTPMTSQQEHQLDAPLTHIPIHVRGGVIIPTQESANNTMFSRRNPMGLLVALDSVKGTAEGELFWDDGDSIATHENDLYTLMRYTASGSTIKAEVVKDGYGETSSLTLKTIRVFGASSAISAVKVNGVVHASFNHASHEMTIKDLNLKVNQAFEITFSS